MIQRGQTIVGHLWQMGNLPAGSTLSSRNGWSASRVVSLIRAKNFASVCAYESPASARAAGLPDATESLTCQKFIKLLLLLQETKLLQSIDRLRGEADIVRKEQRVREALAQMTQAKAWPLSNGGILEVHTPATTRSAVCLRLHHHSQRC